MEERKEPAHLRNLNESQHKAVVHPPEVPLQILAGPGSGKTRTLTCRIAHLVLHHNIPPAHIVAVTFTNKAANEMRHRLHALLGDRVNALNLGTFHAICVLLLRKHGKAIGLQNNFSITDAEESKKIINEVLKRFNARSELKDTLVMSLISKAKAKGWSPEDLALRAKRSHERSLNGHSVPASEKELAEVAPIYEEYMADLKKQNGLDFDDLLGYGVKLLKKAPCVIKCEHIFVDEFQDTNSTQLELMCLFAQSRKRVTVVGDPDQSIYGWRAAEVENLHRMCMHFPNTVKICLEDNYRSTGAILETSIAIISEDPRRPPKTLRTSHGPGMAPTLRECKNEHDEADFIAIEIKRLVAATGGMLKWNDFAILLRYNALSRALEAALQRESIPNRVLSGVKFFERLEIKDLLAYLQLIDNPNYEPSFLRVINVPKRQIGEKSIEEILNIARKRKISPMALVEKIAAGRIPDTRPSVRSKVQSFVKIINSLRECVNKGMNVANLLREVIVAVDYEEYLKKSQKDWTARWENVQELITYATENQSSKGPSVPQEAASSQFQVPSRTSGPPTSSNPVPNTKLKVPEVINLVSSDEDEDEDEGRMKELERLLSSSQEKKATQQETPLRLFLQTSMLSTDTEAKAADTNNENRVTISTCHTAKGLEWPVVFLPGVEDGTFPFYRTEDVEEERRLLYVGCTRAQGLLYLTHAKERMLAGNKQEKKLSNFITAPMQKKKHLFINHSPAFTQTDLVSLAKVMGRPVPDMEKITAMTLKFIEQYNERLHEKVARRFEEQPSSGHKPQLYLDDSTTLPVAVPVSGFASAKSVHHAQPIGAPGVIKSKGRMDALFQHMAKSTTTKALPTVLAPSTVVNLVTRKSQSGSAMPWPSVPSSERPSKDLVTKYSPTPDNASKMSRPSSLTPTHPLPLVASSTTSSHLRPVYMGPDMAPPSCFPSYPLRGAIVPTPPFALAQHRGPLLPQVRHQSPGMVASKGPRAGEPVSASATAARNTADQTVLRANITPPNSLAGAKRRLGMGHSGAGYVSKRKKTTN